MDELHPLLRRQLRRCGLTVEAPPTASEWPALLASIQRTYQQADQDRYTLERSLTISSKEMQQLYDDLQRTSESELMQERDRLESIVAIFDATLDAAVEGVLVVDRDRRVLRYNRAFVEMWGIDRHVLDTNDDAAVLTSVLTQLADPSEFVARVEALYESPRETSREEIVLCDGKVLDRFSAPVIRPDGTVVARVWFFRDITEARRSEALLWRTNEELEHRVAERTAELSAANTDLVEQIEERTRAEAALHQAEEQLRHAQKMEAIGRLAGGIAHDFNNMLTVVLTSALLVRDRLSEEGAAVDEIREDIEQIILAGDRSADLTRQLLAFSRQQVLRPDCIDLNEVVRDLEKMLRRLIGERVDLSVDLSSDACRVLVDRSQIDQVLLNLCVNARDAMPRGGRLCVRTQRVHAEACESLAGEGARGPLVAVEVSDTGEGMDEATLACIFEPFFTTKEQGRGTGLGLATVYGIVHQSGGFIRVKSTEGVGSSFTIFFPELREASVRVAELVSDAPAKSNGTILLVEDEEMVRLAVYKILSRHGYRVLQAGGGSEALSVYADAASSIDLVITDVVMPGMTGGELAAELLRMDPELRVAFMSGYSNEERNVPGPRQAAIIDKPFTPSSLLASVRMAMQPVL